MEGPVGPGWRRRLALITSIALGATVWLLAAGPGAPAQVASVGTQQWVARQDGPSADGSRDDYSQSVATDGAGNVFVAGSTYSSTTGYSSDYQTVKYDSAGRLLWSRTFDGPATEYDSAAAIAVDGAGNAYVAGYSEGTGDNYDFAAIKYDPAGKQLWVARYDSADHGYDQAKAVAVDGAGNVYVAGAGSGNGTYDTELTLAKFGPDGARQWARTYGLDTTTHAAASAEDVAVDGAGNVYVAGTAFSSFVTIKYNAAGTQQWLARFAGKGQVPYVDTAGDLELDGSGNVYVSGKAWGGSYPGTFYDALTVKYSPSGGQVWAKRFDAGWNGNEEVGGLAVDSGGNAYVGTTLYGGSDTYYDYGVVAYDAAGTQRWLRTYHGLASVPSYEELTDVALDPAGNVVVTGWSDSAVSTYTYDFATVSWDKAGSQRWVARYDGPVHGWDAAESLAIDGSGNVLVTGESIGGVSSWDFATVRYGQGGTTVTTAPATSAPTTSAPTTTQPSSVTTTTQPQVTTTTVQSTTTTTRRRRH
jgi:hypothetical protein